MARTKAFDEQEVLQKAIELFWKQGYHATSIQDLVDHLGINRASLYDTYGGKEELFDKAFLQYRTSNFKKIGEFLNGFDSVREGLFQLLKKNVDDTILDPEKKGCFVVNATTSMSPGDQKMLAILNENKSKIESIFYDFLKRGVENGEISPDKNIKTIASFIYSTIAGIKVMSKIDTDTKSQYEMIRTALSVLD